MCIRDSSIATFNIRIFSNNSRYEKELLQICNILKEFDFIAIQEALFSRGGGIEE